VITQSQFIIIIIIKNRPLERAHAIHLQNTPLSLAWNFEHTTHIELQPTYRTNDHVTVATIVQIRRCYERWKTTDTQMKVDHRLLPWSYSMT